MHYAPALRKRKTAIAVTLSALGIGILALLGITQEFPQELALWGFFAAAFVILEWQAVEVNDHLLLSPSIMVAMAAAVVFGPGSATLAVTVIAALGPLTPADLKRRSLFEPLANFGQLVITASAAIWTLELIHPGEITGDNLWRIALGSALAALVYGLVNFNIVALVVMRVYQKQFRPWARLGVNFVPHLGMGFVGGLLGAAYVLVGPVTLPLIAAVFFVGHLTFASYGELREAQEATLRGFVKALEAKDLYTRGHTERVAHLSELIGTEMKYSADGLQRLRWAALIHDVGKLAVPRDLISKRGRLDDSEYEAMQEHVHAVEDILAQVEFLHPIVDIATAHHAHYDGGGYSGSGHTEGDAPSEEACILAVADAFDAMTSNRSYRKALTQDYAISELRANSGTQFAPRVVGALISVLERSGERFGSLDLNDEAEARRLAENERNIYRVHG